MKLPSPRILKMALLCGTLVVVITGVLLRFLPTEAARQAEVIELFCAPSHLGRGEHWVIVGSSKELPADLALQSTQASVALLETQRISARALAARIQVSGTPVGSLLRADSVVAGIIETLPVFLGQNVPGLSAGTNFTQESFVDGRLVVHGDRFLYGYLPATEGGISALRIHNRQTGRWHRREIALQKAAEAREVLPELPPGFREVDPLEALPDTDGDGIYDFEEPEVVERRPDVLGVRLVTGENTLDVVVVDEAGNASWETIDVFTTYTPPVEGL